MRLPSLRALQLLGYGLIAVAAGLGAAAFALAIAAGEISWALQTALLVGAFSATTTLAMRSQPGNGAVWALVGTAVLGAASTFGGQLASARTGFSVAMIEEGELPGAPADYDLISALGINVSAWAWVPSEFLLATVLLVLFPDGQVPSRRWRVAVWTAGVCMALLSIQGAFLTAPWVTESYEAVLEAGDGTVLGGIIGLLMIPLMVIALAAVVRIIRGYRRSEGEERLQYRWVAWALGLYVIVGIFFFSALAALGDIGGFISNLLLANIAISIGVAITKYRLYDIDAVISRTFVYGSLAVFIGGVYVAVVVGIGQLFGSTTEPNTGLALAATAIVAVAFQPLRQRFERVANRLVYGRRATPYEVLSDFSRRVAATDEGLLDELARSLVDGTGADHAAVYVSVGTGLVETAAWPELGGDPPPEVASFPITHDGAELGVLALRTARGQRIREDDHRLATEVASGMGLALRNQMLTQSLHARVAELRESRKRLVAVQDETRRKLERDLHDGAQQQLVALKVKLGLARVMAEKTGSERTASMLQGLATDADAAIDAMRDFARGVYPPLLEAEGLRSAITAHARHIPLSVRVDGNGLGRYPRQIESTVYFCVLEALQNITKFAGAEEVVIDLAQSNGDLAFTVSDDGIGFNVDETARGNGLSNMADRLGAIGGALTIDSSPGSGTTITGAVPVPIGAGVSA